MGRGDQGLIQFYCDMGLLLRYRTLLSAMTELQMATDNHLRQEAIATMGLPIDTQNSTIGTESYFLGDTQQGFASFIMPGIVVLIIQQSLILGITMLCGTSKDRRRRNNGTDPLMLPVSASSTVIGRTLCYVAIYLPLCLYVLHFVQVFFHFPHIGSVLDYMLFILPMLLASAFLAQSVQWMLSERESAFIVVVFTSVAFLFLSGLTWPRYAMSEVFRWLGNLVPRHMGHGGLHTHEQQRLAALSAEHPLSLAVGTDGGLLHHRRAGHPRRHAHPAPPPACLKSCFPKFESSLLRLFHGKMK